ncbi:MAG: cytochrome c [Bacteroidia bacterium]
MAKIASQLINYSKIFFKEKLFLITIVAVSAISFTSMQKVSCLNAGWKAPVWADTLKPSIVYNTIATEKGKVLFLKTCVPCHGAAGKGDGVAGISLNPRPQDLTSIDVQTQTDGAIFWKITNGKPPMASYKVALTDVQRWQLVCYIRKLKQ